MIRFTQALLTGIFFTLIYDFFIFLGIFENYIKTYNIDIYYNVLFADHQNIFLFFGSALILGATLIYTESVKLQFSLIITLLLLSLSTLIAPAGERLAQMMFMQQNVTLSVGKYTYSGDIYYKGRDAIYFYDQSESSKVLKFNKKDIKNEAYK